MRHAGQETLDELEPLLNEVRKRPGLQERKRGVFYRKGRAVLHFHRFSPYACGLVGAGNAWSRNLPGARTFIIEQVGLQWSVLGGVDVRLAHHLRLRAGELAYSKIYLSGRTLSALNASAGFVYRFP